MLRWPDRRVASGLFLVAAIVMFVAIVVSRAPLPEVTPEPVHDPAAAAALISLLERRDSGDWRADYSVTRRTPTNTERADATEIRAGDLHVVVSGTSLTVETSNRRVECPLVDDARQCLLDQDGPGLAAAEVMRIAVREGGYGVTRLPDRRVAGETAECFRTVRLRGPLPGLGDEGEHCFATDGVPLYTRVARVGAVDRRRATAVERGRARETIDTVLGRNGLSLPELTR